MLKRPLLSETYLFAWQAQVIVTSSTPSNMKSGGASAISQALEKRAGPQLKVTISFGISQTSNVALCVLKDSSFPVVLALSIELL